MGQKTHPIGFRLGVIKTWTSKWYEDDNYTKWLHEDLRIKRAVKEYLFNANVAGIEIERAASFWMASRREGRRTRRFSPVRRR